VEEKERRKTSDRIGEKPTTISIREEKNKSRDVLRERGGTGKMTIWCARKEEKAARFAGAN